MKHPDLSVSHGFHLTHRLAEIDRLNGLINYTMTDGEHRHTAIALADKTEKISGSPFYLFRCLDVIRPGGIFKARNIHTSETAPVSFSEKWGGFYFHPNHPSHNLSRLYGTPQVARHNDIDAFTGYALRQLQGLSLSMLVEHALSLTLHYVVNIVGSLPVARKI